MAKGSKDVLESDDECQWNYFPKTIIFLQIKLAVDIYGILSRHFLHVSSRMSLFKKRVTKNMLTITKQSWFFRII